MAMGEGRIHKGKGPETLSKAPPKPRNVRESCLAGDPQDGIS